MGRKRFPVFRTKKGIPLYSKEDIREQYCITNKQLHVLETAQARKFFGCIPNQDWKACRRASLLSSCLRKTKSASDDNLANLRPPDNKPLSWEPSPSPGEIQRQSSKLALAVVASNSPPSDGDGGFELDRPPVPKSLRQTFDEELANAVLRRKSKLEHDVGTKRHTWAPDELNAIQNGDEFNGDNIFDTSLSSRCPTSRPTLLRLRSQDSGNSDVTSNNSPELDVGRVRMAKTMPNTPDLSHGNRCRRQAKTPELSLDERRQKHVSFDSAALVYGHPAISSTVSGSNISASPSSRRPMQSSASFASSKASPDRKSQERLLDIGCGMKKSESTGFPIGKRHGSVRSLDFLSSFTPKVYPNILAKLRKPTKTQATQTEASVTERIAIPAPILAYLTLSPRAHLQESKTTNTSSTTTTTTTATSPSYLTIVPPPPSPPSLPLQQIPSHGKFYGNGKRLTKSRSDSDYRLRSCLSDVKMTVIHLNDSGFQYVKKRHAGRSKSSPAADHQRPSKFQNNGNGQKEIMVTFKPYSHLSNNKNGGGNAYSHKLLKTCSESNVLNGTPYLSGIQAEQEAELTAADIEEVMRERSESDPMLLDTDLVNVEQSDNGKDRQRSRSVTHTGAFQYIPSTVPTRVGAAVDDEVDLDEKSACVGVTSKSSVETTSRESDGGSQYHSLTDQSASSTPTAPLVSRGQAEDEQSSTKPSLKSKVTSSRKRSLDIDVLKLKSEERNGSGVSLDQMASGAGGGSGSSCDADKTVTYSSDTEYGSIRSEDSRTLMDSEVMDTDLKSSESQLIAETRPRAERGRPLIIGHVNKRLSMGTGKSTPPFTDVRFLSPKDVLTSPDSEISWSDQPPYAVLHSKSDLSHTDSTKSEPEGSETSEDYHTATEHSDGIGDTKKRPFLILTPLTLVAHQVTPLEETPDSVTATEDMSYITEIGAIGGGNNFMYNLQSPRSPHASLLSIESSTSGSYTLDSEGNGRKHSSSTICSDSDRELETIFSKSQPPLIQGDIRLKDEGQDVFSRHLEERDYTEEEDEEDKSVTPTPEATLWFSRPRSRTEGNEEVDPKRSESNDRCASVENISKSSEVIERSYSFAAIRMKFERMTDSRSRSGSELTKESSRDRSSSVETSTEGVSLTTSEGKSGAKRKKPEIAAKPSMITRQLPTAAPIKGHVVTEREYFPSKGESEEDEEAEDDEEGNKFRYREAIPSGGGGDAAAYKKDYRRSISESPEATARHAEWDIPRSVSDAQMDLEQMGLLLGAKPRHHHRAKSHEKDFGSATGHSHRKAATSAFKHHHRHVEEPVFLPTEISAAASKSAQYKATELPSAGGVRVKESKMDRKRSSERRKTTGSYSFDIGDLKSHDDNHRRRERSLPGSTEHLDPDGERRVGVGHSNLSKSLPDRQMELYEMSKILCTECGEKLRKIGDDLSESSGNWSTDPSRSQEMIASGGTGSHFLSVDPGATNKLTAGSVPEIAVASSTESLQRRSSGGAIDSPGLSSSQGSSMAETSPTSLFPTPHEEEDEDIGIYADSYRNSSWIYIGDNEELVVWQGRTTPQNPEEARDLVSEPVRSEEEVAVNLHRTDSLGSTSSEKEFRKKYQAVTHRMVHRKSSIEMYKRMSNRTFEIDKTVVVKKMSGEFGFRIHGSRPVVVSAIEPDTAAEACGLEVGDIIIAVNGINVIDASHSEVVKIAHAGCDTLRLDLARTCHILTPVVSAEDMRNPVHCGYLFKQVTGGAAIMQKWCRRWFVLKHDHCLYYFKNELSIEPLGAIMLLNYSVNRAFDVGRAFAFRVTKYGASSYCFAAENEESMNKWANLINQWSTIMGQSDPWIEISTRNLQLPALSIQSPDCHGLLGKMGHRWKSWKKRYCVLKDACMYLYHDINSTTSIGVAHLHGYRMQSCQVQGRKYIFEAIPPEIKMRHYHFYAENDTDRRRWMAAMEYSIDRWIKVG